MKERSERIIEDIFCQHVHDIAHAPAPHQINRSNEWSWCDGCVGFEDCPLQLNVRLDVLEGKLLNFSLNNNIYLCICLLFYFILFFNRSREKKISSRSGVFKYLDSRRFTPPFVSPPSRLSVIRGDGEWVTHSPSLISLIDWWMNFHNPRSWPSQKTEGRKEERREKRERKICATAALLLVDPWLVPFRLLLSHQSLSTRRPVPLLLPLPARALLL